MDQHRSLFSLCSNKNILSDYDHHLRRLNEIKYSSKNKYENPCSIAQIKTMQKWKQTAKNYETVQHDNELKKQNKELSERLWKISLEKANRTQPKKFNSSQLHINHQQINRRRLSERINEQNLILSKNLVEQSKSIKSKSQIKQEMKDYLFRRMKLRKVMSPEEVQLFKKKSKSYSTKLMRLESPKSKQKS